MDKLSGHAPSGAPTVTVPPLEDTTAAAEHATSTDTGSEFATKRYGDDADQQIFALGDAALQLDDVNFDDLFRNVTAAATVTATSRNGNVAGIVGAQVEPCDRKLTVTELEGELQDGSKVRTKIVQGTGYRTQTSLVTSNAFPGDVSGDHATRLMVPDAPRLGIVPAAGGDDVTWLQRARDSYIIKRASGASECFVYFVNAFVITHFSKKLIN